jgi:hypothetical protein
VQFYRIRHVLAELGDIPFFRLTGSMCNGKTNPLPGKGVSGDNVWRPEDVGRARQALTRDGRRERKAARDGKAVAK